MAQRIFIESIAKDVLYCWGTVRLNTEGPDNQTMAMNMLNTVVHGQVLRRAMGMDVEVWNETLSEILARAPIVELRATTLDEAIFRAKFEQAMIKNLVEE